MEQEIVFNREPIPVIVTSVNRETTRVAEAVRRHRESSRKHFLSLLRFLFRKRKCLTNYLCTPNSVQKRFSFWTADIVRVTFVAGPWNRCWWPTHKPSCFQQIVRRKGLIYVTSLKTVTMVTVLLTLWFSNV